MSDDQPTSYPRLSWLGLDGLLITFAGELTEPANRAALSLAAAIEAEGWDEVEEVTTALVSTYLRFDALATEGRALWAKVADLVASRDWSLADLPPGRRLWRIPTVFGTDLAPQLGEAAALAGVSEEQAIAEICATPLRVQTLGFAPGQPYLGALPEHWDLPRQTQLTGKVPIGALTVAIRQMTLFSVTTPTGWRHIGQCAVQLFRPDDATPYMVRPGDEVLFEPVPREAYAQLAASGPDGGATWEVLS